MMRKLVEGSSASLKFYGGTCSCWAQVTWSNALESIKSADSPPGPIDEHITTSSHGFLFLALGEAVSAYILFNAFPIKETFPTIAAIVWFVLAIIEVSKLLEFLVFLVFSAELVDSVLSLKRTSS